MKATRLSWVPNPEVAGPRVELPAQEVRQRDQIVMQNDSARFGGDKSGIGSTFGGLLSSGYNKAKSVFGGVANSVQS